MKTENVIDCGHYNSVYPYPLLNQPSSSQKEIEEIKIEIEYLKRRIEILEGLR